MGTPDPTIPDPAVSNGIIAHLGVRFMAEIGARRMRFTDDELAFQLAGQNDVNHIQIRLNALDRYDIEFAQTQGGRTPARTVLGTVEGIRSEDLHRVIAERVGKPWSH